MPVAVSPASAPSEALPPAAPGRSGGGGRRPLGLVIALLVGALVISLVAAVGIGAVAIAPDAVWAVIASELAGGVSDASVAERQIVWELRLPRTLLAAIVGAGLALTGVAIQALVRNALADPYILGVSSGASVGATLVILFGALGALGIYAVSAGAFAGALVAMVVVYAVAQQRGRLSPLRLVLAGVAAGYVLAALTSFLVFQADARASQAVLFWLLGSFGRAQWAFVPLPALLVLAAGIYLLTRARALNALLAGEETATTLGVGVPRFRLALFALTAAVTGAVVAVSGAVGFVGLIMPHLVRLMVGADHRRVVPVAALAGAVFMVWVDVLARSVVAPQELPVGIITALVGGPAFVWLLRRRPDAMSGG